MTRLSVQLLVPLLCLSSNLLYAGYGDPMNGYPNQQERELHLATNVVRTAPQEFRDTYIGSYNILLPANYPAVGPTYLHYDLNRAGRVHAQDMAANCGLSHNSCNGTSWSTRITSYYTDSYMFAENVASGHSTGFSTVVQLLRDDVGGTPAGDNSGSDGHRKNIMDSRYEDFGPGYAYSSTRPWYHFWVQDFGGGSPDYHAIVAGSHLYLASQKISFMAVFYDPDGAAPQSAKVVINGVPHSMSHHLGTSSRGTYLLELTDDSNCRDYYFQFTDSEGTTWRYPQTTELSNNPSQSCYSPVELSSAIKALQTISNSLQNPSDAAGIADQNGDSQVGLADAISILGQVSQQ